MTVIVVNIVIIVIIVIIVNIGNLGNINNIVNIVNTVNTVNNVNTVNTVKRFLENFETLLENSILENCKDYIIFGNFILHHCFQRKDIAISIFSLLFLCRLPIGLVSNGEQHHRGDLGPGVATGQSPALT